MNVTLKTFSGNLPSGEKMRLAFPLARSLSFKTIAGLSVAVYRQNEMVQPYTDLPDGLSVDFETQCVDCVEIVNATDAEVSYSFTVSSGRLFF